MSETPHLLPLVSQETITLDLIFTKSIEYLTIALYYLRLFIDVMSGNQTYQRIFGAILTAIPYLGLYSYAAFYLNEQLLFCGIAFVDRGSQGKDANVETMTFVTPKNEV